jgi:CHAT domain-containing protein
LLGQISLDENNEKPLYLLLGSGQRELIKSKDYSHPVYWAGFELWGKNEER